MSDKIETSVVKPKLSFTENEQEYLIIDLIEESTLDLKIKSVENYMESNSGYGKSDDEKDKLYEESQNLWRGYVDALRNAKYNFYLNRVQYRFLTDLLLTKLEYDVNTLFFAIELTELLGTMKSAKFTNDTDLVSFPVNATEITYIYHLIQGYKVKGITKDTYTFSKVLLKIGEISKVFNYYETTSKNLSKEIQDWVANFELNVELDSQNRRKKKKEETVNKEKAS